MKTFYKSLVGTLVGALVLAISAVPVSAENDSPKPLKVHPAVNMNFRLHPYWGLKNLVAFVAEVKAQENVILIRHPGHTKTVHTENAVIVQITDSGSKVIGLGDLKTDAKAHFLVKNLRRSDGSYDALMITQVLLTKPEKGLPTAQFSMHSVARSENHNSFNIPVLLSHESSSDVTLNYTISGTASGDGADYTLASGSLIIPAWKRRGELHLTFNDDTLDEVEETVTVTLTGATNATLGVKTAFTYTLVDND